MAPFTSTRDVAAALRKLADALDAGPDAAAPLRVTVQFHTDRDGDAGQRCATVDLLGRLLVGAAGYMHADDELYSVSGDGANGLHVGVYAGGLTKQA